MLIDNLPAAPLSFSSNGAILALVSYNELKIQDQDVKRISKKNLVNILLWDVSKKKISQTLQGDERNISFVSVSPDGRTLASGSDDGAILLYSKDDNFRKTHWIFIIGSKGNWLSLNPKDNRVWRNDDGTLLVNKDENGRITPVPPPEPKNKGILDILYKPASLKTLDGESTIFSLILKNNGKGEIYWINVTQDIERDKENPLVFHPPSTKVILEPDEEVEMKCKVSAFTGYTNPIGKSSNLYLKITHAYGSLSLKEEIPVEIIVPRLDLIAAENDKEL